MVTGLDEQTFGGLVMLEKCAILLYEKKNVSAGGIDFLLKMEENVQTWLSESRRQLLNCKNDCDDACPKCIFYRDPLCHPLWTKEFERRPYIIPNSLLSRKLCHTFLNPDS